MSGARKAGGPEWKSGVQLTHRKVVQAEASSSLTHIHTHSPVSVDSPDISQQTGLSPPPCSLRLGESAWLWGSQGEVGALNINSAG